ncbi:DNA-directed RNA polymerase subunit omega [Verrucomicrobium sp. GAS474]|uniref:DNA-directed RNA polymerase subunit omega n=1 Tax=Verrucomicrobium sp. GAS474 TaxID=1882831 RepID=UPI000879C006|nr:DNA-directed RNA polymerase subunit omega [Verrucomicrobium sp. GAS474]SDU15316.1 DNA-directed RNA polymerase subunit omega [Verrucomicrobium sp. GAS474]
MSNAAFVQEALNIVGTPEVLVNVISRRVRQLGQGARPLVEVHPRWTLMEVALREIADHKLTFELIDPKVAQAESDEAAAAAAAA